MPEIAQIYPKPVTHKIGDTVMIVKKIDIETDVFIQNPLKFASKDENISVKLLLGYVLSVSTPTEIVETISPTTNVISSDTNIGVNVNVSS